jgi:hypothetical protein
VSKDGPSRVGVQIGLADPRDGDAGLGRRSPQRSHHPQPIVGVLAAAVALHHHSLPGAEGDDVGPVLGSPDGLGRIGDRSREDTLDQARSDSSAAIGQL